MILLLSLSSTCKVINNKVKLQSFMYEPKRPLSVDVLSKDTLELFISIISWIKPTHLHLHNLSLSYDTPKKEIPRTYSLYPDTVNLHNLSGPFLYEFVCWMNRNDIINQVRISDSTMSLQPIIHIPIAGHFLKLCNIPTSVSMSTILGTFNTPTLHVTTCPGFDNTVVEWLTKKDAVPGPSGKTFAMETMEHLEILDCINFGSCDMRRLVQTRAFSNRVAPIEHLVVSGNSPVLSDSDMDWYKRNSDTVEVSWIREWDGGSEESRPKFLTILLTIGMIMTSKN